MKRVNDLISKYNKTDNYIVISEFPSQMELNGNTGLSRYSQNTISSLKKRLANSNAGTIILGNIVNGREEIYEQNGILVVRCFKRNSFRPFLKLIYFAYRFNKVKKVLFEFEFATYGNEKVSVSIPLILIAFKLLRKKIYFALHQVVTDLTSLHSHLGLTKGSVKLSIINHVLNFFYFTVGVLSDKVIVLEDEFKQRLSKFVHNNKIEVIPHGIEKVKSNTNYKKENLGFKKNDFIILVFGYVAWYKGVDSIIRVFNKLPKSMYDRNLKLVIAGGKSAAQEGKKHYELYYNKITALVKANKNITLTGFLKEEDIEKYYQIADLCAFPYKTFISSSGPLSFAISFKKPFILSKNLIGYLKSPDFSQSFDEAKLMAKDVFIDVTISHMKRAISDVISNDIYVKKVNSFTNLLTRKRDWKTLSARYYNLLFFDQQSFQIGLAFKNLLNYRTYVIISVFNIFKSITRNIFT